MIIDKEFNKSNFSKVVTSNLIGYDKKKKIFICSPDYSTDSASDLIEPRNVSCFINRMFTNFFIVPLTDNYEFIWKLTKHTEYRSFEHEMRKLIPSKTSNEIKAEGFEDFYAQVENAVSDVIDKSLNKYYDFEAEEWIGNKDIKVIKSDASFFGKNFYIRFKSRGENACLVEEVILPNIHNSTFSFQNDDSPRFHLKKIVLGNGNSLSMTYYDDDHEANRIPFIDIGKSAYNKIHIEGFNFKKNQINELNTKELIIDGSTSLSGNVDIKNIERFEFRQNGEFQGVKDSIQIKCLSAIEMSYDLPYTKLKNFSLDCPNIKLKFSSDLYTSYLSSKEKNARAKINCLSNVKNLNLVAYTNMDIYIDKLSISPETNLLVVNLSSTRNYIDINLFIKNIDFQGRKGVSIKCSSHINVYVNGKLVSNKQLSESAVAKEAGKTNKTTNILAGADFVIKINKYTKFKNKNDLVGTIQLNGGRVVAPCWGLDYIITDNPKDPKVLEIMKLYKNSYSNLKCISERQFLNLLNAKANSNKKRKK